jgi:hypothetical protein
LQANELADRYGVAAADDDSRRLAQAVKLIPKLETSPLPRPRLDQSPKDHQMRNKYQGSVKRVDVPYSTQVEARHVQLQDAAHAV